MAKDPFAELDPDVQAMRASMRPSAGSIRWGYVLCGVLVVACVTFGLAYHVPLRSAHQALSARFAEIQAKVDSAERAADDARKSVKELGESKQALEKQLEEAKQRDKARTEAGASIKSALEPKLQKQLASDQAALGTSGSQTVVVLSLPFLLTKGKVEVNPAGKAALCSVAAAANKKPLRVLATAAKKDIPPALAAKLKTPLQYNLAVAEAVTQTLLDKCAVSAAHATASATPAASPPVVANKKLAGARVELWLETAPAP